MKKRNKDGVGYVSLNGKFHRVGMYAYKINPYPGFGSNGKHWVFLREVS